MKLNIAKKRLVKFNFFSLVFQPLIIELNIKSLVILLLFITFSVNGQVFSSRVWHAGRIVLNEKDPVTGDIMYNMETNTVQLQVTDKILKSYSSKNVFFFEIYDKSVSNYRQFYSIPYNVSQNYKIPIFFELLYEGALTLLVRERIVFERSSNFSYTGNMGQVLEKLAYTYYFVDKKGKIKKYSSGKKADLFLMFDKNSDQIREFVKTNRLRPDRMKDLVRITAFYNSL